MSRKAIFDAIEDERAYQDENWGSEFDDANTVNDWVVYVMGYMSRATIMEATPGGQREALLKAATLLVAAIETFDRNSEEFAPRHYEWLVPSSERPMGKSVCSPSVTKMDPAAAMAATRQTILDILDAQAEPETMAQEIPRLISLLRMLRRTIKQTDVR